MSDEAGLSELGLLKYGLHPMNTLQRTLQRQRLTIGALGLFLPLFLAATSAWTIIWKDDHAIVRWTRDAVDCTFNATE